MHESATGSIPHVCAQTADGHAGTLATRVAWLGRTNKIFTTGATQTRSREVLHLHLLLQASPPMTSDRI